MKDLYNTMYVDYFYFINEFKVVCALHVTQCVTCLLYLSCLFISMVLVLVSMSMDALNIVDRTSAFTLWLAAQYYFSNTVT